MEISRREHIRGSLRNKVGFLIVVTAAILGALAIAIGFALYSNTMTEHNTELLGGMLRMAAGELYPEEIDGYLADRVETPHYLESEEQLKLLLETFGDITYVYVYRIAADGCHVVFDIDTADVQGVPIGEVIPVESAFEPYMEQLLAGEAIGPVVSNGEYGWLFTMYLPVRDASGRCVAHVGADIAMHDVIADRCMFVIRMFSLLTGATIIIAAFALWYAQRKIVRPINQLAAAASRFAYTDDDGREKGVQEDLHIHTGDEIENLYLALQKTVVDISSYIRRIKEAGVEVEKKAHTIETMQQNIILSFANMIESRDENTGSHVRHTAGYVQAIGRELLREGVLPSDRDNAEWLQNLTRSAPLHDVGKIRVPDAILNKPGRLTPEEFDQIKRHTTAGRDILTGALTGIEDETYLSEAVKMAACHHEWWNGAGYPAGLSGADIPMCARIMAVADVFDALISRRSYKGPIPFDEAVRIIEAESGTHFDPAVVQAFLCVKDEIRALSAQ